MKFTIKQFALAATLGTSMFLAACGGGGGSSGTPSVPDPGTTPVTLTVTHTVLIRTSKGDITVGLDRNHAPITVDNFLKYVDAGFYKNTVFHRVIKDFVIQGGGVVRTAGGLTEKTALYAPITLESNNGLNNVRGTLAMARTGAPNSATSQFFINNVDNAFLNYPGQDKTGGYAVFGKVTAGMEVVDAIRAVATNSADVPLVDVTITEVKRVP